MTLRLRRIGTGCVATLALATVFATPSTARETSQTVAAFYDALRAADGAAIASLLTKDAVVRLADLGFDMSREEFVDSMDVWSEVADGMTMRVRPEAGTPDTATSVVRIVCYEFGSNTSLTREVSTLRGDLIARNEQEEIGTSCEGF